VMILSTFRAASARSGLRSATRFICLG
jgi:hypothetical protein